MPKRIVENLKKVIIGKDRALELVVAVLLARGHLIIQDIPGTGKTILSRALARSIGGTVSRIQFTSDMLPSDVTGTAVYNAAKGVFEIRKGPVFANIVLADEINRATPRTQSALLECLGEGQVTIEHSTFILEKPFMVIATQNPVYFEGCYNLVESELDRFTACLELGYPEPQDEAKILRLTEFSHPLDSLKAVVTKEEVVEMSELVLRVHASDSLLRYITRIMEAIRKSDLLSLAASPRASISLLALAKARAFMKGRDYVEPDDIKALAHVTLSHRIVLKPVARARGITNHEFISNILEKVDVLDG